MLKVTHAIPIVFAIVPDPVGASIVESADAAGLIIQSDLDRTNIAAE
jgi:ABC-type uncharacterized transport system substrate-binding protein